MPEYLVILDIVAWPAAFLLVFFAFRAPLADSLSWRRYRGLNAELVEVLRRVEDRADRVLGSEPLTGRAADHREDVLVLADQSAVAAVALAWNALNRAGRDRARRTGGAVDVSRTVPHAVILDLLRSDADIGDAHVRLYDGLRQLRVLMLAEEDVRVPREVARRYAHVASRFGAWLESGSGSGE